ncbi:response regulator transcription factor [Sphingomonas nostoxanthinifaciens]|uniref:response regulator transcription factor n=1 Tax=Sphingomonas nostoxanthinifaciens TaxID=2872652 RepID=UPI001CC21604|nr:response regulator transcription factor [Sphingomonas nostoxanthinifaciens]UAK23058.1 response regulator transcription factor [Sphingomonas nostoxanthinifaciens]
MRIAVLEDEADLAQLVANALRADQFDPVIFGDGRSLVAYLKRETVDLLILDWNVPGMDGDEVLLWARQHLGRVPPVLFMTSRTDEVDIVRALNAGADDYLVKPIRIGEAMARVRALLRRSYPAEIERIEMFDTYHFDRATLSVAIGGDTVALSPREFELASFLFRNRDRALSRSYLMERVWGHDPEVQSRTLDVHVSRLREKLRLHPQNGYKLVPVYSYGYRLERVSTPEA